MSHGIQYVADGDFMFGTYPICCLKPRFPDPSSDFATLARRVKVRLRGEHVTFCGSAIYGLHIYCNSCWPPRMWGRVSGYGDVGGAGAGRE